MTDQSPQAANPSPALKAGVGTHVCIEVLDEQGNWERMEFDITPDRAADFGRGFLGESTPLAKAILGQAAGSHIPYQVAELRAVRILSVSQSDPRAALESEARRKEAMAKAIRETEKTSAINFASSFSGKWGDYDPSGIEKWEDEKKD